MKKILAILLVAVLCVSCVALTACNGNPDEIKIVIDMQKTWKTVTNSQNEGYPQAGVILSASVYHDSALVSELLQKLQANDEYILNNPEEVDALLTTHGSATATATVFNRAIIERCNIDTIKASEVFDDLTSYYTEIQNPLPDVGLVTLPSTSTPSTDTDAIEVYVPDGAPALAIANLMKEGATLGGRTINVTISNGNGVKSALLSGAADIVILPTTAAAGLYNQGKDIRLLTVSTWGLLYLVGKNNSSSFEHLIGKTIYCIGKTDTPGILLRKYLDFYNIDYVEDNVVEGKTSIIYVSDATAILPLLKSGQIEYAILGEPAASKVIGVNTSTQN